MGRQNLVFRNVISIDKLQNNWYIFGGRLHTNQNIQNYYCESYGLITGKQKSGCLIGVNQYGELFKPQINSLFNMRPNIFYPVQVKDWGDVPNPLHKKKLGWVEKLNLQTSQPKNYQFITNQLYVKEQFQ